MGTLKVGGVMTTAGFANGTRRRSPLNRVARGVSLIELLVVLGIVTVFSILLISGYRRFQSGFNASAALSRVESALHYARNLAIANNAVYHVRFETCDTLPTSPTYNSLLPQAAVGIYCFTDMSTALTVTNENCAAVNNANNGWNPFTTLCNRGAWNAGNAYDIPNVVSYNGSYYQCNATLSQPDPTLADPTDPTTLPVHYSSPDTDTAHWTLLSGPPHNNTLVEKVMLPAGTYFGVQYLTPATAPYDQVLFFRPDGSASSALTLFVTDEIDFADNRGNSPPNPYGDFDSLQAARRKFFNDRLWTNPNKAKQPPWLKMIQIFGGGLIKQRAALLSQVLTPL